MEERKVAGVIVDEMTAEAQTRAAMDELMGVDSDSHNMKFEKMYVVRDGQTIEIEVPVDDIDLLDDMDDDELTEEGERSLGIIDGNYDSTSGESPERFVKERMMTGTVEVVMKDTYDDSGVVSQIKDYIITCPYTGSTEVYKVSTNIFASYETDQHFYVDFDEED